MERDGVRTAVRGRVWRALLVPALPDVFFAALLAALFAKGRGLEALLGDGDTGWHIRAGEYILATGHVPVHDLFSFSRPGAPWFAWEWLSDVVFAALFGWHGLEAVAVFAALMLSLAVLVLLVWMLRRGAGLWLAAGVALAAASASSVHYLARPHIFSLLLFPLALWVVDEDRRRRTRALWLLVPLAALWANLHAGFFAWLGVVLLLPVAGALERDRRAALRYARFAAASIAATFVNPYGWRLHAHILRYLGSGWILDNVQEFQSPRIRSENMVVFAVLLLAGAALAGRSAGRGRWFEAVLVWGFGFAALRSARHIPLYAAVAAPVIAGECAALWERARPGGVLGILRDSGLELGRSRRVSLWAGVLGAAVLIAVLPGARLSDFPPDRFPVAAVQRNERTLAPARAELRILTSDQWADYLIFRLYPLERVFFDGRSDFYGAGVGGDYQALLSAAPRWREAMARYRFDAALLPVEWPLAAVLESEPGWRRVYRDGQAVLFLKQTAPLPMSKE